MAIIDETAVAIRADFSRFGPDVAAGAERAGRQFTEAFERSAHVEPDPGELEAFGATAAGHGEGAGEAFAEGFGRNSLADPDSGQLALFEVTAGGHGEGAGFRFTEGFDREADADVDGGQLALFEVSAGESGIGAGTAFTEGFGREAAAEVDTSGLQQASAEAGRAGEETGDRWAGALTRRVLPAIGLTVSAHQAWNATIAAGFERLSNLEDAEKRFHQMGLEVEQVDTLMTGLNESLTGTPFRLDEGAGALARFVSAGMDLEDVNRNFDLMVDTAAFAQAPLSELTEIFERIQTEGQLTGETLRMLQVRGVPALQLLADAAGVTEGQLREMITRGEVDAGRFFDLWEQGSQGFGDNSIRIAGAAQSMGDTTSGALANMTTGFSRLGATILEVTGVFDRIKVAADDAKGAADLAIDFVTTLADAADRIRGAGDDTEWWQKSLLQLNAEMEEANEGTQWWNKSVFQLVGDLRGAANEGEWWAMSLGDIIAGSDGASDATEELSGELEGAEEAALGAADGARHLSTGFSRAEETAQQAEEAVRELTAALFDTARESIALEDRQDRLSDAIDRAREMSDNDEASKREQRAALRDVARESLNLVDTMVEQEASTEDVRAATERARRKFLEVADDMGIPEGKAHDLADAYGLIPDQVATEVEIIGEERARERIANIQRMIDGIRGRSVDVTVNARASSQFLSTFGPQGFGGQQADGGIVGRGISTAASGLIRQPMIARAGANILWAEPETGGESYIPWAMSKRPRALEVLGRTAREFDLDLIPQGLMEAFEAALRATDTAPPTSPVQQGPRTVHEWHVATRMTEAELHEAMRHAQAVDDALFGAAV